MNRSIRSSIATGSLLALTIIFGACGSREDAPDQSTGEPEIGPLLAVEDIARFRLPLDDYRAAGRDPELLGSAEYLLVSDCLDRYGLELPPPADAAATGSRNARRYGITDQAQATERGYRGPASAEGPEPTEPPLPPAVEAVVTGRGERSHAGLPVPEGGCIGESRRELSEGTDQAVEMDLGERLAVDTWHLSKNDSRVRTAFGAWSACMTKAGYDYADPFSANDDPAFQTPEPSAHEIEVATADVRCKQEADLVTIWGTVETAYQQRTIAQHAEPLAAVRRNLEITETNAATALAAAGEPVG
jgi:hypothetical protein